MNYNIFSQNQGINDEESDRLFKNYNIRFPQSYIDFLRYTNGFQSVNSDLIYSSKEVEERNQYYEVKKYMPDYLAIGDGDGEHLYLMKKGTHSKEIFVFDSVSIAMTDCLPECVFKDFYSFMDYISKDRSVEDYENSDCYKILLTKPVDDMKQILKIKKIFNFTGDLKTLLDGCKNVPFILKENVAFGLCQVLIKQISELSDSFEIRKQD